MSRGSWALCVLCALCSLCGVRGVDYCKQLQGLKLVRDSWRTRDIVERALTERGTPRVLALSARGAAPEAARALLTALLRHQLRYREEAIVPANYSLTELQAVTDDNDTNKFILSLAQAWHNENTSREQCKQGACGVAGSRLDVLELGVVPTEPRLLARLAPGAPTRCLQDWDQLRTEECGFLDNNSYTAPCSNWPNNTCPEGEACVTVAVGPNEDEQCAQAAALAQELTLTVPLRLVPMSKLRGNQSILFFDYYWSDRSERVRLAPPPCRNASDACPAATQPFSMALGDVRKLALYAQPVLDLALRFRPPAGLLRRVIANASLGLENAACEAIVNTSQRLASKWLACDDQFCNPNPAIKVYDCKGLSDEYSKAIASTVSWYWRNTTEKLIHLEIDLVSLSCSDTVEAEKDLRNLLKNYKPYVALRGVVAMGAGAAVSKLPQLAAQSYLPLLLTAPQPHEPGLPDGTRSAAAGVPALVTATRALLGHCGWTRLALMREEGRSDIWKRSLGVANTLRSTNLTTHTELVSAENVSSALNALKTMDARIVLVDASTETAALVLDSAEQMGLTPKAGYVWIVVGAASYQNDSDWLPHSSDFSYMTLGGWRGGAGAPGGSARFRAELDASLAAAHLRWSPSTAAFADALLMMFEGVARLYKRYPEHRNDPHRPDVQRLFFEELDNITLEGTTYSIRANASIPVFAHRWSASGPQLAGTWIAGDARGLAPAHALCGEVTDGPTCYTTYSGARFTPRCHDFAYAIILCALALAPPALCAARAARRRRLALRDRAVEERVLLRAGQSVAEAAVGAALAGHSVPRNALQLLDELGAGHYGVVHQAVLRRPDSVVLEVAAKAARADAPAGAAAELLREAALLATLRHDHIVRFAGVCWEGGPLVLMEHALYGDLRRYLRARRTLAERARAGLPEPEAAHVAAPALTRLAREAAAALGYLADHRLVHRDIRAANCLIDARRSLKLADFGMARRLSVETRDGEYLCKRRAMFPVLWMAPESLSLGVSSLASDVWALGVLMLELATLGERPFGAWRTSRVLRHVCAGGSPPLPRDATPSTRGVTAACWSQTPEERPSAAALVAYLAEHPRAIQPALEDADGDDDAGAGPADTNICIDEWSV